MREISGLLEVTDGWLGLTSPPAGLENSGWRPRSDRLNFSEHPIKSTMAWLRKQLTARFLRTPKS
jgi:hypothetical protein